MIFILICLTVLQLERYTNETALTQNIYEISSEGRTTSGLSHTPIYNIENIIRLRPQFEINGKCLETEANKMVETRTKS